MATGNESVNLSERTRHFEQCRPKTSTDCKIEAQAIRPLFQAEVRRYFWQRDLTPTSFKIDVCYLELALNPRPDGAVNYLNSSQNDAFVATGNCCFIPANQKTMMRLTQGKQLVIGCMFEQEVFEPYIDWDWSPLEMAACINLKNLHINNVLLQISQELLHPGYKTDEWLDSLFHYLLIELSRHIRAARTPQTNPKGKLSPHQLRLIDSYIHAAEHSYPQTSELADHLSMSSRHLSRLFKNTTGQTISDHVNEARINRAKTELLNSTKKVKEIAFDCGFLTPSAFTKAFRTATGLTPKQFRHTNSQE